MRYILKLEAVGDNHTAYKRHFNKTVRTTGQAPRNANLHLEMAQKLGKTRSWVARITGLNNQYGFERDFIKGQKDYSTANGTGSRGIYLYYFLEPGFYEISDRRSWSNTKRYFARVVNETTIIELSREEVIRCL